VSVVRQQIGMRHRVEVHCSSNCKHTQMHQQFVIEQELGESKGKTNEERWSECGAHQGKVEQLRKVHGYLVRRFVTQYNAFVPDQKADERESH